MEGPTKKLNCGTISSCGRCGRRNLQGAYRLGRIHSLHPHIRRGKEIIRRATVAVLAKNTVGDPGRIEYVLRDLSKIAPV